MRRPDPSRLRQLVLLALTPVAASCTGKTVADTSSVDSGTSIGDAAAQDAAAQDAGPSRGGPSGPCFPPLDAGLEYVPVCNLDPNNCVQGAVCDPSLYASAPPNAGPYDNGCAPSWLNGDGCYGGEVLYPCGVDVATYSLATDYHCELCMGSPFFSECWTRVADGGVLSYLDDAGNPNNAEPTIPIVVTCGWGPCEGRRPAALVEPEEELSSVADALARSAYLEAASVTAFLELSRELGAYGAPRALVRRVRRAAADEVEHARAVGALARARGARPVEVQRGKVGPRSLLAIALENAREGCVRETWGAACAVARSIRARDPDVRLVMERIAEDELRHAALSSDVADWLALHLTSEERQRVAEARERAIAELSAQLDQAVPESWQRCLGFPSPAQARAILAGVAREVWAA